MLKKGEEHSIVPFIHIFGLGNVISMKHIWCTVYWWGHSSSWVHIMRFWDKDGLPTVRHFPVSLNLHKITAMTKLQLTNVWIKYNTFPFLTSLLCCLFDTSISASHRHTIYIHTLCQSSTYPHSSVVNRQTWWETCPHCGLNHLTKPASLKPTWWHRVALKGAVWWSGFLRQAKIFTVMKRVASIGVGGRWRESSVPPSWCVTNVACFWV